MGRFPPCSFNVDSRGIRDLAESVREEKDISDRGTDPCGCLHVRELSLTAGKRRRLQLVQAAGSEFRTVVTR